MDGVEHKGNSDFHPHLPYVDDYDYESEVNLEMLPFLIEDHLLEKLYPPGSGLRDVITVSEYKRYLHQVVYSGGFDVDPIPDYDLECLDGIIQPKHLVNDTDKYFMGLVVDAIKVYNKSKSTHFEAVRIVKMNFSWMTLYVTFEATYGELTKEFQTLICQFHKGHNIELVREKPRYTRPPKDDIEKANRRLARL